MDFGKVLYNAQKNKDIRKEPIKYYSTKFAPPKKEQRDKARISVNVKKFLEKKEEEEKQKRIEAQRKKEELLALRSKDKKAVKRVNVMLKRTKSANQSVIQDAVDSDNTAITLVGPAQPDEDDYGYVSQEAAAFYSKMMDKYNKMPEEPSKFLPDKKKVNTNLNSTKDRVRAALEKEKEEALMPHKRKRKHKEENSSPDDSLSSKIVEEKPEAKKLKTDKVRPKMPPPMNFNDLLKLAEKKQFEPVVFEKKAKEVENPLTKKQQREMEKMKEWQSRKKENKISGSSHDKEKGHKEDSSKPKSEKIPTQSKLAAALTKGSSKSDKNSPKNPEPEVRKKIDWGLKHPSAGKINGLSKSSSVDTKSIASSTKDSGKLASNNAQSLLGKVAKSNTNGCIRNGKSNNDLKRDNKNSSLSNKITNEKKALDGNRNQEILRKEMLKAKQFPPNDLRPKQIPPNDLRPKQFPPNDLRPKQFPPTDIRRPSSNKIQIKKRRILDDDDDEYDSEMDDFIDDGPEEEENYSKYIQEIFGYNKSKYANMDDDVDLMESSFCQQMREEEFSSHIGELEDIEQERLEQEHKRRKALMKKKMKK
ncbi:protein SPT2 homolog [Harmonia axyridis]|uniref:protein SPT2 homolog n=1 Tax=Harmonia axyridis TaxID=115357 RepID=UPI001E2768EB|nr:protein SPT2 homolog [Harmonia axyridis]